MRRHGLLFILLVLAVPVAVGADAVPFDSDRWVIEAREHRIEEHLGRPSLYLKGGQARVADRSFVNGVVEFDIAFSGERGFMGAIWRVQDAHNHEEFYIRPHQSGNPDANQYTPVFNGQSGWQLYHGEGYGAPLRYVNGAWLHVKIVFSGSRGEVYLDDMQVPASRARDRDNVDDLDAVRRGDARRGS